MKNFLLLIVLTLMSLTGHSATIALAGDSWLAGTYNPNATSDISGYTCVGTANYAVNSKHTGSLLSDLQSFYANGGNLGANATAIIDIGLPDFLDLPSTSRATTQANLYAIVDILAGHNVKVLLSGAPDVDTASDVNAGNLTIDALYNNVKNHQPSWVRIVDLQSPLMMISQLGQTTGFPGDHVHLNTAGYQVFNIVLANKFREWNGQGIITFSEPDVSGWIAGNSLNYHDECVIRVLIQHYGNGC